MFEDLKFDEAKHIYTLNGVRLSSVSAEVSKYYKKFDSEAIATAIAKRQSGDKLEYIKIKNELLESWSKTSKEAAEMGSLVHKFAEDYLGSNKALLPNSRLEKVITDFWNTMDDYTIEALELRMYIKELGLAGTLDVLLKNPNGQYEIWDYKTNKDLYKNYKGQKMLKPFDDMLDTPYSHYVLQQNFYKLMLMTQGVDVTAMNLVSIQDSGFSIHAVPDITDRLIAIYGNNLRNYFDIPDDH